MNKLKKYFLEANNKKYSKSKNQPVRFNINYNQAQTIGILFSSENIENIDALTNFVKMLQQDGKQVKALTFHHTENKKSLHTYNFNHHVITDKDISNFGEIKSFLADDFINAEFDYLLCIDNNPSIVFENILQKSKAKCRIGKFIEGQGYYELMIKINENEGTDALMKQMYHYVKTIKND
ncbi:MAG TPA: hypothetical protein VD908_04180 [Cytophagales bacterium]|nr:hypothetical protein [Cytophagales bacterium]